MPFLIAFSYNVKLPDVKINIFDIIPKDKFVG